MDFKVFFRGRTFATWKELVKASSVKEVREAVRDGLIERAGHDRYALSGMKADRAAALRVNGSLSHLSAARAHGWQVKALPAQPQVVVPHGRKVSATRSAGIQLRFGAYDGPVTGKVRTVIDCCRDLPFDEALAVTDQALRDPDVTIEALMAAALSSPRTGRARVLRVLGYADPRAYNTFESVLRALCIEAGLDVEPQVQIDDVGACDVGDRSLMIAIEAESYRYHSSELAFQRDATRYAEFTRREWLVLRFTLDDVLERPDHVRAVLSDVAAIRRATGPHHHAAPSTAYQRPLEPYEPEPAAL